jgi:hypothetical protein
MILTFKDRIIELHPEPFRIQYVKHLIYDIYEVKMDHYYNENEFKKALVDDGIGILSNIEAGEDDDEWDYHVLILKANGSDTDYDGG